MWVIGGYIHDYPKHVQLGREIGAAPVRDSHLASFQAAMKVFLSACLAISGYCVFLGIG